MLAGTLRWQAPELLDMETDSHTTSVRDVYTFAIVFYEASKSVFSSPDSIL